MELLDVSYDELGRRLRAARLDDGVMKTARLEAGSYLSSKTVKLETDRGSVDNAFVLAKVLRDMMNEAGCTAMTINNCMSTIMPI